MATKYEVEFWKDQCRKLTAALDRSREDKHALTARIMDNSEEVNTAKAIADGLEWQVEELTAENAKLRDVLRALTAGTNSELCADRDYPDCKECSMNRDRESCTITDAMELLGCDAYGEPMGVEEK